MREPSRLALSPSLLQCGFFPRPAGETAAPCLEAPLLGTQSCCKVRPGLPLVVSPSSQAPPPPTLPLLLWERPRGRDSVLLECDTPQLASTSGPTGNRSIRAVEGAWMLPRVLRPLEGWLSGIGFLVVEGSTDQLPASCFGPLSSWKTCFVLLLSQGLL